MVPKWLPAEISLSEFDLGNGGFVGTVDSRSQPWQFSDTVNSTFQFGSGDGLPPLVVDLTSLGALPGTAIAVRDIRGRQMPLETDLWLGPTAMTPTQVFSYLTNVPGSSGNGFPSRFMTSDWDLYLNALVGTFADEFGNIVGQPFAVNSGIDGLHVPQNATRLQLGINDDIFGDNLGSLQVLVSLAGLDGINDGNGVFIRGINGGEASQNIVQQNYIGTDTGGFCGS